MEHQRFWALHLGRSRGYATTSIPTWTIGHLSSRKCSSQDHYVDPTWASTNSQQSVNDCWTCSLDNLTAMELQYPKVNPSAAVSCENFSHHIVSVFYNWPPRASKVFAEAQNAIPQWTVLCCSYIKFDAVSPCNLTLYTTSQICMQCLTFPIYLLVEVESIFQNLQSALMYQYIWQSFESD